MSISSFVMDVNGDDCDDSNTVKQYNVYPLKLSLDLSPVDEEPNKDDCAIACAYDH